MPWIARDAKTKHYRVMWRTGGRGSKVQSSDTYQAKADALAFLRDMKEREQRERRVASPMQSTPLADLLESWSRTRQGRGKVKPTYVVEYRATIMAMAEAQGWQRVSDITAASVEAWCAAKGKRGVNKPLAQVQAFLRWCRRIHKIRVDDDVYDIEKATIDSREQPPLLSDGQVAQVLALAYEHGGQSVGTCIAHLALYPRRPIEMCRLKVSDWDGTLLVISYRESKNKHTSKHAVHDQHAERLDAITVGREPDAPLFLDPWGRPWRITAKGSPDGIVSWYRQKIGERLLPKVQRGIGCLKDYAMTRYNRAAGGDRKAVMSISGHLTADMVDTYSAANSASQRTLLDAVPVIEPATVVDLLPIGPKHAKKTAPRLKPPLG